MNIPEKPSSPKAVQDAFVEVTTQVYEPLGLTVANYRKYIEQLWAPLHASEIDGLEYRLRVANERTHRILKTINGYRSTIYSCLTEKDMAEIVENAWFIQTTTEIDLERVLRHSSRRMKYFPKTFAALESIDPAHLDNLTYESKLQILEIAGTERDQAIMRERPKLLKILHSRQLAVKKTVSDIVDTRMFWELKQMPLYVMKSADEASVEHLALASDRPANEVNPHTARLGRSVYELAKIRVESSHRTYSVLEQFLLEEVELIDRLRTWFHMKNMYRPANIDEYVADFRPTDPIS